MEEILAKAAEFGPTWLFVFVLCVLLYHFGTKLLEIYGTKVEAQTANESKREERKQDEANARIEHDREMAEVKGQMVEALRENNVLMAALKTLMESVEQSNRILHDDLTASREGSRQMQSDMKDVKTKVDLIYQKEI